MKLLLSISLLFLSLNISAQNMLVSDTESSDQSVSELVESWLYKKNIVVTDISYPGRSESLGIFSNGFEATGLSQGMLITTGRARTSGAEIGADGLSQEVADVDLFWFHNPSDARSIPPTTDTARNAVLLTLTFKALTDTIYLDYAFGSEDYQDYDCMTGDDYFGIIMSGPNYSGNYHFGGELVSLTPDSLPIRVSTVHPETENCSASNEDLYYQTPFNQQPVYHGMTSKFTTALAVDSASLYRIRFLIADGHNEANDAGLFFNLRTCDEPICFVEDIMPSTLIEACSDTTITFDFSNFPEILPISYALSGTATVGEDYPNQATTGTATVENPIISIDLSVFDDGESEYVEDIILTLTDSTGAEKEFFCLIGDSPDDWFLNRNEVCSGIGNTDSRGRNVRIESAADNAITETFDFDFDFNEDVTESRQYFDFEVSDLPFESLYSPYQINSICVNIAGDNSSYDFWLIAPSGERMRLAHNLSGSNITNCCFSPKASLNVDWRHDNLSVTQAPYTGTWQPLDDWESLKYAATNGTWSLYLTSAPLDIVPDAVVENISISFRPSTIPYLPLLWSDGQNSITRMVNELDEEDGILTVNLLEDDCLWSDTLYFSNSMISQSTQNINVCSGDTVWYEETIFAGGTGNTDGLFLLENASFNGCDSLVELNVFVRNNRKEFSYHELPLDSVLVVGDSIISEPGFYSINLLTQYGCDSTVYLSVLPPPATGVPNESISGLSISENFESCDTFTQVCIPTGLGGFLNNNLFLLNDDTIGNSFNTPPCELESTSLTCYVFPNSLLSFLDTYRMPIGQLNIENESPFFYFDDTQTLVSCLNYLEYGNNYWFTIANDTELCSSFVSNYDTLAFSRRSTNSCNWSERTMLPVQRFVNLPTGMNLPFPIGESTLIIEKENFPNDTVFVNVEHEYPSPQSEHLTISTGQFQSFLLSLDASELCGDIISAELCNEPNLNNVEIDLHPENGDLRVYTLEPSIVEICVSYCDSLNICDELLLSINIFNDSNSTDEIADLTDLKIYPNPVSDNVKIEVDPSFLLEQVEIYSALGEKVDTLKAENSSLIINVQDYPTGIYFLEIKTNIGVVKKKFIVVRE